MLRKANREFPIDVPDFTEKSDLDSMRGTYSMLVKHISVNGKVDLYRSYLIGGFVLTEIVLGRFAWLDMAGFAKEQMSSMSSYDMLLIELGEKTYVPKEKQLPVELRLLGIVLINVALFIAARQLMKRTGTDMRGMLSGLTSMTGAFGATGTTAPERKSRPRMRGPDLSDDA